MNAQQLLEVLAEAPYGVYAVDMGQRIVFWNNTAERLLGYCAGEMLGRRCHDAVGGVAEGGVMRCEGNCSVIQWSKKGRIAPSQTLTIRTKDGARRWMSMVHVLLQASTRERSTVVHIFHDVSQEVEARQVLQKLSNIVASATGSRQPAKRSLPRDSDPLADRLSQREREVLQLLAQGVSARNLAEKLDISAATVRNHIQHILSKLGAHSRLEAVVEASRQGLL